jgi:transcriptional regulator with XRE-family HTH domain
MPLRIRRARTAALLSQKDLADRVGVHRSAVTQWEQAIGTNPSVDHLARIACETCVCFEWLATGRGQRQPVPGEFETAAIMADYARDELESRILESVRRAPARRREALACAIELLVR